MTDAPALPNVLRAFLDERGAGPEVDQLIRDLGGDDAGLLLVGSVAEARHTAASDLDLLVLLAGALPGATLSDEVAHPTALGSESLGFVGGIEVNPEYVLADQAAPLGEIMGTYAAALGDEAALVLPVPDIRQLRLLDRLRAGVVVSGAAMVDRWRSAIRADLVPGYIFVLYYVTALDYLEDALGWMSRHPLSGLAMGREAATACNQAFLALHGLTHHDPKWIALDLDEVSQRPGVDRDLVDTLRRAWFPDPDGPVAAQVEAVREGCTTVFAAAAADPAMAAHVAFARRYCAGRYRYDLAETLEAAPAPS